MDLGIKQNICNRYCMSFSSKESAYNR